MIAIRYSVSKTDQNQPEYLGDSLAEPAVLADAVREGDVLADREEVPLHHGQHHPGVGALDADLVAGLPYIWLHYTELEKTVVVRLREYHSQAT